MLLPADLVAKLNQCATSDFVGPRDHAFTWLARFTTAVFVGLVLELPELRYELKLIVRDWIPYFRYRILSPPERRLHGAKVIAFVGWILIVAGVGGERYEEVRVKDFDASIQECSDAKVREATLEAGGAATSSAAARADAAIAKKDAAGAESEARGVSEQAKILSAKLHTLEGKANDADGNLQRLWDQTLLVKNELDEEHGKRLEMEKSLSPRMLPATTGKFGNIALLRPFFGIRLIVEYVPDAEARRAAEDVRNLVRFANWKVTDEDLSANPDLFEGFFDGVIIETYDPDDPNNAGDSLLERLYESKRSDDAAAALISTMRDFDWRVRTLPFFVPNSPRPPLFGVSVPKNAVKIMIGMKPNDFQRILPK